MSPERRWWRNVLLVLRTPSRVFAELRSDDPEDVAARQEPILLIVLLAGIAGMLATSTAGALMDDAEYDALLVAVWAFVGGIFYGAAVYLLGGVALWLGARGMGSLGDWRRARHVLAFSGAPVGLSLLVVLPVRLLAFGGDAFRSGGSDAGAGGSAALALQLAFVAWSLGLLVLGLRVVYGFTWARAAGTFGLVALFLAAITALPSAI
jgi:hypothetical protein